MRRAARAVARVLLAIGLIGALASALGLGVTYVIAPEHVGTAFAAFEWSGRVLCLAGGAFLLGRPQAGHDTR